MKLQDVSVTLLGQLTHVIAQLTPAEYARPLPVLLGSSVGKHLRHVIEFYNMMLTAHQTGHLNYDRRVRQTTLETSPQAAIDALDQTSWLVDHYDTDRLLTFEASYSPDGAPDLSISTTYYRELHYNIEHAIHHSAIIRIGVEQTFSGVVLPPHFGLAHATVQHEQQHVQTPRGVLPALIHLDHVQLH